MPRTKENPRLSSRTAREELPARHEPYWHVLEKGRAIGYRKGTKGGTWYARYHNAAGVPPTLYQTLGAVDDHSDADAVEDYIADRKRSGAKTADRMAYDFNARVIPILGTIPLDPRRDPRPESHHQPPLEEPEGRPEPRPPQPPGPDR